MFYCQQHFFTTTRISKILYMLLITSCVHHTTLFTGGSPTSNTSKNLVSTNQKRIPYEEFSYQRNAKKLFTRWSPLYTNTIIAISNKPKKQPPVDPSIDKSILDKYQQTLNELRNTRKCTAPITPKKIKELAKEIDRLADEAVKNIAKKAHDIRKEQSNEETRQLFSATQINYEPSDTSTNYITHVIKNQRIFKHKKTGHQFSIFDTLIPENNKVKNTPLLDPQQPIDKCHCHDRIKQWYFNPEEASIDQNYGIQESEHNNLLKQIGAQKILDNHTFPRAVDGYITTHGIKKISNSKTKIFIPGTFQGQLGAFTYAYGTYYSNEGKPKFFHRCFKPLTSEELTAKVQHYTQTVN